MTRSIRLPSGSTLHTRLWSYDVKSDCAITHIWDAHCVKWLADFWDRFQSHVALLLMQYVCLLGTHFGFVWWSPTCDYWNHTQTMKFLLNHVFIGNISAPCAWMDLENSWIAQSWQGKVCRINESISSGVKAFSLSIVRNGTSQ